MKVFMTAILGTLLVLSQQARAQDQNDNRGFNPPGTSFGNNPFNGGAAPSKGPAKSDELFEVDEGSGDDEDELDDVDVDDISDEILRQRMEQRLKERSREDNANNTPSTPSRKKPGGIDFSKASQDVGATSMMTGASSKITPGPKGNACLKLDPYTGYGPDVITNFDFPDADIVEIAKTLGRLTCLNFILDKDVKGRISIVSNSSITVGDAWKAFLTALDVNGFSLIPSGRYIRIARQRDAKDKQIKTYSGDFSPDNDLYITRVLPLKYISAEEVARVFRNFMPPNTRIISYDQTNTLMITDTAANIKKIVDMVQLLDVEGYDEGLEVIHIKYAAAQDIAKLIDQLLPGNTGNGRPGAPPGIPRFRSGFSARKTKEGGVISHIIPDDRTNSVIVSANAKGVEQVKELIAKLDQKVTDNQGGNKIHVVYLQFAEAEQVAATLNNLASNAASTTKPITAPGAPGAASTPAQPIFEGSIKISADKPTNSLVITGTPSDFVTVQHVISKLDVPRDQVYVESIIMETELNKEFDYSASVALPTSGIGFLPNQDLLSSLANPLGLTGTVMGFQTGKGSKTFTVNNQSVTVSSIQGLIKAIQTNSNSNVIATPQILTLDNQEAEIEISENVPIPVTTSIANSGVQSSIQREKIALNLKIKPQINKISNFVKLEIHQKLEDISDRAPPPGVANLAFSTIGRSSQTTVIVQDRDTVAMGGLTKDKVTETQTKVPLLGDIPILGWLFRSENKKTVKNNLIVFITPQIIKQYQQVRTILDKKIRERDRFLEKSTGGEDPLHDYKMDMIKSLPPVSELKNGDRVESGEIDPDLDETKNKPTHDRPRSSSNPQDTSGGLQIPPQTMDGATAPGATPNALPNTGTNEQNGQVDSSVPGTPGTTTTVVAPDPSTGNP